MGRIGPQQGLWLLNRVSCFGPCYTSASTPAVSEQALRLLSHAAASSSSSDAGHPRSSWAAAALAAASMLSIGTAAANTDHHTASWLPQWAGINSVSVASCEAGFKADTDPARDYETVTRFTAWLEEQGADISNLEIRPSQAGANAGYGLFLRKGSRLAPTTASSRAHTSAEQSLGSSWWRRAFGRRSSSSSSTSNPTSAHEDLLASYPAPTLATFPFSMALTAENVIEQEGRRSVGLRSLYNWMLDKNVVDERTLVMVALMVEKLRGDSSHLAPWIAMLPESVDTPAGWTAEELEELRGTPLYKAASRVNGKLEEQWQALEPILKGVSKEAGLRRPPTFQDLVWANNIYWSRGQSLPVPLEGAASMALARGPTMMVVHEGVVPGLDLCNHRTDAPCWWEVVAPESPEGPKPFVGRLHYETAPPTPAGTCIELHLHATATVPPDGELTINYGDRSNEELLMLYGFTMLDNPNEAVMMAVPIPAQTEWDDMMLARMDLLRTYKLTPQFFLADPRKLAADAEREAILASPNAPLSKDQNSKPSTKTTASTRPGAQPSGPEFVDALVLPASIIDTLEIFMMNYKELAAAKQKILDAVDRKGYTTTMETVQQHSPVLDLAEIRQRLEAGTISPGKMGRAVHDLGLRMATLTTLVKLLEIRVTELENEETGTGSLEHDEDMLQRYGPTSIPPRTWSAIVYRAGQKRVTRGYLERTKKELARLMKLLSDLEAARKRLKGQLQDE